MRTTIRLAHGFTLIELLAVIAIASLVMSISMVSIGNLRRQTDAVSLVGGLRSMDARARLHARTSGSGVELQVDSDARSIRLMTGTAGVETTLAHRHIPNPIGFAIETAAGNGIVCFDQLGVSDDYVLVVSDGDTSRRLVIAGLTGDVRVEESPP